MVHWQTEQWRLQQRERDEIKRHIEQLEDSLDKRSDTFRSKIPSPVLQEHYDTLVGGVKGTYDFSKSMIGVGIDAGVFLQKALNPLGWFDHTLQAQLRKASDVALRMERANLALQFGSLQEKKRVLTKAADIAHRAYEQARKSMEQQWTEAGKTPGKQTELASRWATRLTLEIGTLVVGVGEAKGAVTAARAAEAAEFSEATKAAATGAKAGTAAAKEAWVGEAAGKELQVESELAKAGESLETNPSKLQPVARSIMPSQEGINSVSRHLEQFGTYPPNDAMIERLRSALEDGRALTGADANFYLHETSEAAFMNGGLTYDEAHAAALAEYKMSPFSVYHPDVINSMPEYFNDNWRLFWGIK